MHNYCRNYGTVSEDMFLNDEDTGFEDWHVTTRCAHGNVKMLCCPEDLVCCNVVKGLHTNKECCEACGIPMRKECASRMFALE